MIMKNLREARLVRRADGPPGTPRRRRIPR